MAKKILQRENFFNNAKSDDNKNYNLSLILLII